MIGKLMIGWRGYNIYSSLQAGSRYPGCHTQVTHLVEMEDLRSETN